MTVYVDELFALNFITDYILLLLCGKICAADVRKWRAAAAAGLGGFFAIAFAVFENDFFLDYRVELAELLLLVLVCFGRERHIFKIALVFAAISAAFAGAVLAVENAFPTAGKTGVQTLLVTFGICYLGFELLFKEIFRKSNMEGNTADVRVELCGKSENFCVLIDTGCTLREPISGGQVLIADCDKMKRLISPAVSGLLSSEMLKNPVQLMPKLAEKAENTYFRLIPYTSLGNDRSFLLAVKPDRVTVNGQEIKGAFAAISPTAIQAPYSGILSADAL